MIDRKDLERYIDWIEAILPIDFEKLNSQDQITKLIQMLHLINSFRDNCFDIFDSLQFSTDPYYTISYELDQLNIDKISDVYTNSVLFSTVNIGTEDEYLIYKDLINVYEKYQPNFIMIRDAIVTIVATILEKLTEIKYEIDNPDDTNEEKSEEDNSKTDLQQLLIDLTIGAEHTNNDINYLREKYYEIVKHYIDHDIDDLSIDFDQLIGSDLIRVNFFGMSRTNPDSIVIDFRDDRYKEINIEDQFDIDIYTINVDKILDCSWLEGYRDRALLKSILISMILTAMRELK